MLLSMLPLCSLAQQADDNSFGGWFFAQLSHDLQNGMCLSAYLEHDNYQFQRLEKVFMRFSVGYKPCPWLKTCVNYVPSYQPEGISHCGEVDVVGTLRSGDLKVSIRERYRHGFSDNSHVLRSRLKVEYDIPDSPFGLYLAPEVFTWGNEWKKTRHYCACTYDLNPTVQLEAYYLYYTFKNSPAENVIGIGVNLGI